ncbi:hypothetical protein PENCOP_c015G07759 [Penicillium coprophilum]|uniref:Uncharacterized protein n=1 Tax=Penicillium coprophilum TaxID=36646 RepID=A0A1V6UA71_9EURO|nr:hypothetical protein PENCOP_c015G07759 [Penicillium coprophilum]
MVPRHALGRSQEKRPWSQRTNSSRGGLCSSNTLGALVTTRTKEDTVNRRTEMAAIDAVLSRSVTVVLVSVAPKPTANPVHCHLWFGLARAWSLSPFIDRCPFVLQPLRPPSFALSQLMSVSIQCPEM